MISKKITARRYEKIMQTHDAEREEWAMLIGHFMLAFGDIEHLITLAIEFGATDQIMGVIRQLQLSKRIELCKEMLEGKDTLTDDVRNPFLDSLAQAKKLTEKRNLIAHNSVRLQFRICEATNEYIGEGVIASSRNEKASISLRSMTDLARQTLDCSALMNQQFSKLAFQLRGLHLKKGRVRKKQLSSPAVS